MSVGDVNVDANVHVNGDVGEVQNVDVGADGNGSGDVDVDVNADVDVDLM